MNRAKWNNYSIPLMSLALKLGEEAAELGGVMTDVHPWGPLTDDGYSKRELRNMVEECEHVEFIVSLIKRRAQEQLTHRFHVSS